MNQVRANIFVNQNAIIDDDEIRPDTRLVDGSVLSSRDLVDTFPEARKTVALLVKKDEQTLRDHHLLKEKIYDATYSTCKVFEREIVADLVFTVLRTDFIEKKPKLMSIMDFRHDTGDTELRHLEFISDRLIRNKRLLALYKLSKKKNKSSQDNFKSQIEKARLYPIENIVHTDRRGWAKCPLHSERTPSFHIRKNNKYKCFSCGEAGDVIDLVMRINSCGFVEAVRKLL